jgi:hypothetical protein
MDEDITLPDAEHLSDEFPDNQSSDAGSSDDEPKDLEFPDISDDEESGTASATSDIAHMTEHDQLIFDAEGDLCLVVGEGNDEVSCLVSSRCLARASRVFKSMLFGGFAESKPLATGAKWIVRLPEDDINAMAIILHIIHGQVHKVPEELPVDLDKLIHSQTSNYRDDKRVAIDMVYQITVATDKYHVTHLLKPWAESWLNDSRFWDDSWSAKITWIAWVLGDETQLKRQVRELILSSSFIRKNAGGQALVAFDEEYGEVDVLGTGNGATQILGILNISGMLPTMR